MKKLTLILGALALTSSGPILAHEHKTEAHADHKCEMMKDGKKMDGMMKKNAAGEMSCQMMDHSKMDHSKMDHNKMDHNKMDHGKKDNGKAKPE